jgi:hypothetical protein
LPGARDRQRWEGQRLVKSLEAVRINRPPIAQSVNIIPNPPHTDDAIVARAVALDPDSDAIQSIQYEWLIHASF